MCLYIFVGLCDATVACLTPDQKFRGLMLTGGFKLCVFAHFGKD